jgi:hypothetical protein
VFVTLKKDYLGHKAGATLDIHEESVAQALVAQGKRRVSPTAGRRIKLFTGYPSGRKCVHTELATPEACPVFLCCLTGIHNRLKFGDAVEMALGEHADRLRGTPNR